MHIAQIAPLTEAIPPKLYGGTERVVSWLTDELVSLGHDVVLFASGDSRTTATLEPSWPTALRLDGAVLATADAVRHDAARPPRSAGAPHGVRDVPVGAGDLDLGCAAPAGCRRRL